MDAASLNTGEDSRRYGQLKAHLDFFIAGGKIKIGQRPRDKHASAYMARTDPISKMFFDVRCTDPKARMRVLGRFSAKDVFVALVLDYRENLIGKAAWQNFIQSGENEWSNLFGNLLPVSGDNLNVFLSRNYTPV